ncbi:MAG: endonuclease/exonuclease/phosphatase family protein [Kiloniellales bacterium]
MAERASLRVATYNLESLDVAPDDEATLARRIAALGPYLTRLEADVICFQEVNGQRLRRGQPRELFALSQLCRGTIYEGYQVASTKGPGGQGVAELHNLVVLSRWPFVEVQEHRHAHVHPPTYRSVTASPPASAHEQVCWDRPILHVEIAHPSERRLHVLNLHLRAPLAAPIRGQKRGPFAWKSLAAWAEGYYLAALKRSGQALEARLLIERLFDRDREALIAVCGDFNAEARETPLRIVLGDDEDTDDPGLIARQLMAVEGRVPPGGRYSLLHAGRKLMLDHILVSRPLHACLTQTQIHNWDLQDECLGPKSVAASHHAPIVAVFDLAKGA